MASLKAFAQCLWVGAGASPVFPVPPPVPFSVVRHLFGYQARGYVGPLSVKTQLDLVGGRHFHLNLIRVGLESFTPANNQAIDAALESLRTIYANAGFGIGRVLRFEIAEEQANDSGVVQGILVFDSLADDLTNAWTVHNNGLDVFLVLVFDPAPNTQVIGRSAVGGPCDKDDSCVMTGCVVSLETASTGQVLAHEAGHYLGLSHINNLTAAIVDLDNDGNVDPTIPASVVANLMFPVMTPTSLVLNNFQRAIMTGHCFAREGC